MKKMGIALLAVLLAAVLVVGGLFAWSYFTTTEATVPTVTLGVDGANVAPRAYSWVQPLLFGVSARSFTGDEAAPPYSAGEKEDALPALGFPEGFESTLLLTREGETVWSGTAAEWAALPVPEVGSYELEVTSHRDLATAKEGHGQFVFRITFGVTSPPEPEPLPEPAFAVSAAAVAQGDVLALQFKNLPGGVVPVLELPAGSPLQATPFQPDEQGGYTAYLPTSFDTAPGEYTLRAVAGDVAEEVAFAVTEVEFPRQDLEIDLSDPVISEANSQAAYDEYNRTIPPLFSVADEERHWEGPFVWPCEAWLSTYYGHQRFTNGSALSRPHKGIDIAAGADTPIVAPANGRVLFADYLLNTGYTLVIEHGGGLKSIYYHMNAVEVATGDMVAQGQRVGLVGSTGYSTGAHLHFDVRILDVSIDPVLLLDGGSHLYAFFEGAQGNAGDEPPAQNNTAQPPAALPARALTHFAPRRVRAV